MVRFAAPAALFGSRPQDRLDLPPAWTDAGFLSGNVTDGIVLSKSSDGGNSWAKPVLVNRVPTVQAFMPVVAVSPEGAVAITYYDFRKDTPDPAVLLTNLWRIVSHDGGESWTETAVTDTFDLMEAPLVTGNMPMIGDYIGLVPSGSRFLSFFGEYELHRWHYRDLRHLRKPRGGRSIERSHRNSCQSGERET